MHGSASLITTLAAGLGLALASGYVASRVGIPPLIGYLFAGVLVGPATPGFVADAEMARQLAEIGVMLMMFGVGLHFSLEDLLSVRRIAIPGALVQIAAATAMGALLARLWAWPAPTAFVFGLSLSVASTVVLLRALEARGALGSVNGRIALGWLVVEDIVVVLILVLLPVIAPALRGDTGVALGWSTVIQPMAITLAKVGAFVGLVFVLGRRVFPRALWAVASSGSRELFTLAVISTAVGVAYLAAHLFSVSFALGAFFAGMMMGESELSHRAAEESLPFREAFSVLFFVSVGMLFDPRTLLTHPLEVLGAVTVVVVGKTLAAVALVLAFRYPLKTALTVGAGLAQIGEFSFILAGLALSLGLLPTAGHSLVLAAAIVSIALNPLLFRAIEPIAAWAGTVTPLGRALERRHDPLAELPTSVDPKTVTDHVLVVGHGRVGRHITEILGGAGVTYVIADLNRDVVASLRARGAHAVSGDAAEPSVLIQAHVARARILVVAVPDMVKARRVVEIARTINPRIHVLIRTHGDDESKLVTQQNLGLAFMGERELGAAMARHVLGFLDRGTALPA